MPIDVQDRLDFGRTLIQDAGPPAVYDDLVAGLGLPR